VMSDDLGWLVLRLPDFSMREFCQQMEIFQEQIRLNSRFGKPFANPLSNPLLVFRLQAAARDKSLHGVQ